MTITVVVGAITSAKAGPSESLEGLPAVLPVCHLTSILGVHITTRAEESPELSTSHVTETDFVQRHATIQSSSSIESSTQLLLPLSDLI